uniref:RNA-dependent RNA polymerase n=1 Tax=Smith virus TaxID=2707268 RepID=A0A6H0DK41_9VIRU|nr:MAG: RNA-dependent RNA polymerase [Smith virus]
MENTITNSLCKGIRACGLPKKETLSIVNTVSRWVDSSGEQWTVDRLKSLHHWYITIQAGNPEPPTWVARHNDYEPKGSFRCVFNMKNTQKALAILSCHTVFLAREATENQISKFEKSTLGNKTPPLVLSKIPANWKQLPLPDLTIGTPPFEAITGRSIPVMRPWMRHNITSEPNKRAEDVVLAYASSWMSVPQVTLNFICSVGESDIIPPNYLNWGNLDSGGVPLTARQKRPEAIIMEDVGSIGLIQEPSLKGRWVANPNRVAQWATRPLADHWYSLLKATKTDCTFNQERGVKWVQEQLANGISLSGADMTSASDLLSLESSLRLLCKYRLGRDLNDPTHWSDPVSAKYRKHIQYFIDLSRGTWSNPHVASGCTRWRQGQPLGTAPSFALLGLTNNLLGALACREAGIPEDRFRVIGDDMIMDTRAMPHYVHLVERMGGQINREKTVESDRLAEFAGRVITASQVMLKRVKYKEVSDNSFMALVSRLGDQAKSLLKPRQRTVWNEFRFVPGVVVEGPYSGNSYGIPLEYRYDWYLQYSNLSREKLKPDEVKLTPDQFCSQVWFTLRQMFKDEPLSSVRDRFDSVVPLSLKEDFQSSLANAVIPKSRDPRLGAEGEVLLRVLEGISRDKDFTSFRTYISMLQNEKLIISDDDVQTLSPFEADRKVFLKRLDNAIRALGILAKANGKSAADPSSPKPLGRKREGIIGDQVSRPTPPTQDQRLGVRTSRGRERKGSSRGRDR